MCGIVGYLGKQEACRILMDGLKRLEYRGYDSSGIAVLNASGLHVERAEGKLSVLENRLKDRKILGTIGIGHTRWATHGIPSERNAHPHRVREIVAVHNGIIENYSELRQKLLQEGCTFQSETDSEIFAHLIYREWLKNPNTFTALQKALAQVRGSYSLVVLNEKDPYHLYLAKLSSPLVVGFGEGENFVASDIPALLPHTRKVAFLEDGELGILSASGLETFTLDGKKTVKKVEQIDWDPLMAEKEGYKHFMLKEIFEQPHVLEDALSGRIDPHNGQVFLQELEPIVSKLGFHPILTIVACGTSYHAGLVAKYWLESFAKMQVGVDLASEFRYRNPLVGKDSLVIGISQSGETADTLAAMKLAKQKGAATLAICNVVGSSLSRLSDAVLYTHAGPEIGVASTKAFVTQLAVLLLLALYLGQKRGVLSLEQSASFASELRKVPQGMKTLLEQSKNVQEIARRCSQASQFLFIGRGPHYPVALEGALKLKEISYLHAEGFASGELKHGPIALVNDGSPVVALLPQNEIHEKVLSNVAEVKARGAWVIGLGDAEDKNLEAQVDVCFSIPKVHPWVSPILYAVPLQLFAYYIADHRGTDVDQPRNLAKSVTVE